MPFYGEMGSLNPVFLLPGALDQRADEIASGYIQSVNLGVGQFCTNPGAVLGLEGGSLDTFLSAAKTAAEEVAPATMLHPGIHAAFEQGQQRIAGLNGVNRVGSSSQPPAANAHQATCNIYESDVSQIGKPEVSEEVFGPSSIVFKCQSIDQMMEYAKSCLLYTSPSPRD